MNGPPVVRDLRTISTVAVAGELTEVTYRPQGTPDSEWPIAFAQGQFLDMRFEGGPVIESWRANYDGVDLVPYHPRWTPDGQKLYFMADGGLYYIASTAPTTTVRVVAGSVGSFAISPDGARIVYGKVPPTGGNHDLYRASASGSGEVRMTTNGGEDQVYEYATDSTFIASVNGGAPARYDLSATFVKGYLANNIKPIGKSWDGRYIFNDEPYDNSRYASIAQLNSTGTFNLFDFMEDDGYGPVQASASPDNKRWVFEDAYNVYTTEFSPVSRQQLEINRGFWIAGVSWQPALGVTKFVGSSGRLGSTSAGIVATYRTGYGRNGLASFVNWDAQTRSTSTVSDDNTDIDAGAKTYTIEADRLTALRFGNRPFYTNISTVNSGGTTNGAVVSVDSQSGVVTSVVLYVETRGVKPTVRRQGTSKVIEGSIQGVWNAKGENLAPNGAARVTLARDGSPTVG